MTTTDIRTARRKPKAIEFTILYGWHAAISGAFIVAYLSGDEDTYAMHQFAGYAVLVALAVRVIAAIVAPAGSPLRLRRPQLAPLTAWAAAVVKGGVAKTAPGAPLPRRPLFTVMAAVLLIVLGASAGSGAIADFTAVFEDLHEALGELALWIVLAHVAIVVAVNILPKLRRTTTIAGVSPAGRQC